MREKGKIYIILSEVSYIVHSMLPAIRVAYEDKYVSSRCSFVERK